MPLAMKCAGCIRCNFHVPLMNCIFCQFIGPDRNTFTGEHDKFLGVNKVQARSIPAKELIYRYINHRKIMQKCF